MTQDKEHEKVVLTMPISDTLPGPGSIQFSVDSYEEWQQKFLFEDPEGSETEPGFGTANDISSTSHVPVPGTEPPLSEQE